MNKIQILSVAGAIAATTALNAQLTSGFDQRYQASDYTIGTATWSDAAGTADATASNAAGFSATTTPSGAAAIANATAGAVNGNVFAFTRTSELGSTGQFTIQSVIRIDDCMDDRSGPFAINQTSGWGGLYAGANADGSNAIRGGNIGNTGGSGTVLNGTGGSAVTAGTWGIYTIMVDATVAAPQFTVTFTDLATGLDLFSNTIDNGTIGTTLGLSNDGVLFGGEQGGGASATNGWGGAVADVVVYNTALSGLQLAANETYFQTTYQVPEPSAYALIGGLLALGTVMVRRRHK